MQCKHTTKSDLLNSDQSSFQEYEVLSKPGPNGDGLQHKAVSPSVFHNVVSPPKEPEVRRAGDLPGHSCPQINRKMGDLRVITKGDQRDLAG